MNIINIDNLRNLLEGFSQDLIEIEIYTPYAALDILEKLSGKRVINLDDELLRLIVANFSGNQVQWSFEDKSRDSKASDREIANVKRAIDKLNQRRTERMEEINNFICRKIRMKPNAKLVSETPGSLIDRINILHLRKGFLEKFILSNSSIHLEQKKLREVTMHLEDLYLALKTLLKELNLGNWRISNYAYHKLYNNPKYNNFVNEEEF